MKTTTFEKIRSFKACESGWRKLLDSHNPKDHSQEISIRDILKSNGIKDAVWALRAVDDKTNVYMFCADVAESVLNLFENKYPDDKRPRKAIEATRKYANKEISKEELSAAADAAADAAYAADAAADDDAAYAAAADTAYAAADAAGAAAYAAAAYAYAANAAYAAAAAYDADTAYAAADAAGAAAYAAAADAAADAAAYAAAYDAAALKWSEIEKILMKYI